MFEKQTRKGQTKGFSNSNSRAKQSKNDQSQQDNCSKSQTNPHNSQPNGAKISLKNHILKKISNNKDHYYFQGQTHTQKSVSGDGNQPSTDGYPFSKAESQSRMKSSKDQETYYSGLSQKNPRHVQYNTQNVVTDKKKAYNRPPVNSYYQTIKTKSISQNTLAKNPHYTQASTYPNLSSNPSSVIDSSHASKHVTSFDYMHSTPSASVKNQNLPQSRITTNEINSQQNIGYLRNDYTDHKFLYVKDNFNNEQQQLRRVDTNEQEDYIPSQHYNQNSLNSQSMNGDELNHIGIGRNTNSISFYVNKSSKNNVVHLQSFNSCEQYSEQSQSSINYNKNYPNSYFNQEHLHYNKVNVGHPLKNPININQQPYQHHLGYDNPKTFFKTNENNANNFINNVRFFNDGSLLPVKQFVTCHGKQLEKPTFHFNEETPNTYYQNDKTQPDSILFPPQKPNNHNFLNVNGQFNSKSSLTVRNPDRDTAEIRNKSHTKNYSNAQVLQTHQFLQQYTQDTHTFNTYASQDQSNYGKTPQFLQSTQSNNTYVFNLASNINNKADKAPALDQISEKDEFGKAFLRSNQKNDEKAESTRNIKHIQRQQDSNKSGKQKISVISENILIKSFDAKLTSNSESVSNLSNLRYIKSPTNTDIEAQSKNVKGEKIRTGEKYLKVSYNPLLSHQKSREEVYKQHEKSQTHSVNSSFKENKSQMLSVYQSGKGNIAREGQKPISKHEYVEGQGERYKQTDTKMKYNSPKLNAIQICNSNSNLHKNQKQYSSNQIYRTNIDFNQHSQDFHDFYGQNKQHTQFVGVQQNRTAFYDSHDATRGYFKTSGDMTFTSPDLKQFVRSINAGTNHNATMQMSLPEYSTHNVSPQHQKHTKNIQSSAQKLTLFSPKQKDLQPVQKNHFLGDTESQKNRQSFRQKKSIKKMLVSQSKGLHTKPQVLVSLNFKDLLRGQSDYSRPNSRKLIEVITKNHLTKIFCSTFKIGENQNGCDCIPKCFWVERWIEIINRTPLVQKNSMMKNLDKNVIANLNGESLWMNFTKDEVVTFADVDTGNLNKDEIQTFKQIDKDIPRTFSSHPTFKNQRYREFLRQLLIHSYYLDPQLGYVQGMNIIGASIVYHSKTVYEALKLMDFVMNVLDYKKIFLNEMRKCRQLALKTTHIIKINCYDLYTHVTVDNQVDLEMFILGWYLSMLGTFVPLEAMHFVINKFIQKQFGGIMKIIVTYFIFIKDILMEKNDPNQIMQELSVQAMSERSAKIDWNELISVSDKLKLSLDKKDL